MQKAERQRSLDRLDTDSLLEMACNGDRGALCELLERCRSLGRRAAFSILKNHEDAEDALQEASLRALLKFSTFERKSAFSTWFTRIVINTCLMHLRKRRSRPAYSLDEMLEEDKGAEYLLRATYATPEQECQSTELHALVHTTVKSLPVRLRHVAEDRFYDELSLHALAGKRGISVTAAKSRLFRVRRLLGEAIRGEHGAASRISVYAVPRES